MFAHSLHEAAGAPIRGVQAMASTKAKRAEAVTAPASADEADADEKKATDEKVDWKKATYEKVEGFYERPLEIVEPYPPTPSSAAASSRATDPAPGAAVAMAHGKEARRGR